MNRNVTLSILLLGLAASFAWAQDAPRGSNPGRLDLALGYTAILANAPPNNTCGCFWMQGGSAQAAVAIKRGLSGVADFGMTEATKVGEAPGYDITLSSYLLGPRYSFHRNRYSPYAQVLAGAAHSSTNDATDNGSTAFAFSPGVGLDLNLKRYISLRVVEADYLLTRIPNGANNVESQLRLTTGIVLHLK